MLSASSARRWSRRGIGLGRSALATKAVMVDIKRKARGWPRARRSLPRVYLMGGCSSVEREDRWRGDLDGPRTSATTRAGPAVCEHECLNILHPGAGKSNARPQPDLI